MMESLLDRPYWVIDILPEQVPKENADLFFAVEKYYLRPPLLKEIRARLTDVLLKLNCYSGFQVCFPDGEAFIRNPAPEQLASWMMEEQKDLRVLLPGEDALITVNHDELYMTVYNPPEALLNRIRLLAAANGLFLRRPEDSGNERRTSMDALEAIITRRSTRNFRPDPVEQEKLDRILQAGRQAPSGGNNQTSHFFVIRNRDVLDRLVSMTEKAFAAMEITEDMYSSMKHAVTASKKGGYVFCYNAPLLIAVANRTGYGNNIADCACAIENMMVAANALDLGSCWINQLRWLNEDPEILAYLRGFGMKEDERVYGAVIIGYPATESGLPNRGLMAMKGNEVTWID